MLALIQMARERETIRAIRLRNADDTILCDGRNMPNRVDVDEVGI